MIEERSREERGGRKRRGKRIIRGEKQDVGKGEKKYMKILTF